MHVKSERVLSKGESCVVIGGCSTWRLATGTRPVGWGVGGVVVGNLFFWLPTVSDIPLLCSLTSLCLPNNPENKDPKNELMLYVCDHRLSTKPPLLSAPSTFAALYFLFSHSTTTNFSLFHFP